MVTTNNNPYNITVQCGTFNTLTLDVPDYLIPTSVANELNELLGDAFAGYPQDPDLFTYIRMSAITFLENKIKQKLLPTKLTTLEI